MRVRSGLSSAPAIAAWVAMSFLSACGTLGTGKGAGEDRRAEQAQVVDDDDDDCELLVVRRDGPAEIVEEKTPEMAEEFYLLIEDRELLEGFEIDEEEEDDCLAAFGIQSAAAGGLAPAAFGATIPGAAYAAAAAVIAAGVGLGAFARGGGNNTTSTTGTQ